MKDYLMTLAVVISIVSACSERKAYEPVRTYEDAQQKIVTQFILAEDSSTIELPEGHFLFTKSLILDDKSYVTIRGQGMDKTILSFKDQAEGAEGLRVSNSSNIIIENLTVEDAAGDNLKVTDTDGITLRKVKAAWTGPLSEANGAYGLYPVLCKNVVIEECEVLGSSDAGIYVGQSEDVVIRNNKAYWNVAGIESENSENVKIYGNEAYNNTGGILVFDLPGLTRYGKNIEVYNNKVYDNNTSNFAAKGNIVGVVPKGTGMIVLATEGVSIHDNEINEHETIGIAVVSYDLVAAISEEVDDYDGAGSAQRINTSYKEDKNYNPYPRKITINNNTVSSSHWITSMETDFGKLFLLKFGFSPPDIIWDGIESDAYYKDDGQPNPHYSICIDENEEVKVANLDAANDFENLNSNAEVFRCDI